MVAAESRDRLNCVKALVAAGADLNAKQKNGWTALMLAAGSSRWDCVKALVAAGADVNAANEDGRTALMLTAANGNWDCVKTLVAAGANVNAEDKDGFTALRAAIKRHNEVNDLKKRSELFDDHPWVKASRNPRAEHNQWADFSKQTKERQARETEEEYADIVAILQVADTSSYTQTPRTSKSNYWKCPKCGGILQKGAGAMFAETIGVATCGGCGAKFSQSDVYGGKYDVEEKTVDPKFRFRIIGSTAFWGDGNQATFNNEYSSVELEWLLDGNLFPISSQMTKAECRELVEGNFPAAFQIVSRSSQQFNLPKPEESNGYTLAIIKLHLSYAVRNNVAFAEAQRIYKTIMDFK